MPNTQPIFPVAQKVSWGTVSAANTAKDGSGTVVTVATGGTNGTRLDMIKVRALGTNTATVMRFYVNNGQPNSTPTNNSLVHEITLAATTLNEAAAFTDNDITITRGADMLIPIPYLPPGYKLNAVLGTAVAAGYQVTVFGGDY